MITNIEGVKGSLLESFNRVCESLEERTSPQKVQAVADVAQAIQSMTVSDEKMLKVVESGLYAAFNKATSWISFHASPAVDQRDLSDIPGMVEMVTAQAAAGEVLTKVSRKIDLLQPSYE